MCVRVRLWMHQTLWNVVWSDGLRIKYGWMGEQLLYCTNFAHERGKWKCEGRGEWFVEPGHVVSEELAGFVFCCWRVTYIIQEGQQDIDDYQRFLIVWKITLFLFWKSQNSFPFLSVVCQDSYCTFFLTKRENIITDPDANPRQCFYNHTFLLKSFLPLSFVIFS